MMDDDDFMGPLYILHSVVTGLGFGLMYIPSVVVR